MGYLHIFLVSRRERFLFLSNAGQFRSPELSDAPPSILLWNEWIDNLALRRVFYLEHDHYKERKDELKYLGSLTDPELDFQSKRPPFIPHPEVRDTVPNISLYSVLYKLPDYFYSTAALADSSMLDRQLASTVDFFDKCVPNQPGYSSSVAAVTIIPDTTQVAQAWRKWYRCASRLRRLRFIRRRIIELEERLPTNNVDGDESVIDFQESTSLFESLNGYKNADGEANINTEGVAQRGLVGNVAADPQSPHPSSPHAPSLTPSPRHRKDLSILSTVEEFDDILSDPSSTHLLRRDDIEQARIAEMDIEISARRDEVDTAGDQNGEADKVPSPQDIRIRRSASDELSPFSSRESEIEIKTPSDSLSKKENAEDRSKPVQPRVPPIETQSASNDHSDERRFACPSDSLRKSPDSVGLAEEAKLDAFISDEGMEQVIDRISDYGIHSESVPHLPVFSFDIALCLLSRILTKVRPYGVFCYSLATRRRHLTLRLVFCL